MTTTHQLKFISWCSIRKTECTKVFENSPWVDSPESLWTLVPLVSTETMLSLSIIYSHLALRLHPVWLHLPSGRCKVVFSVFGLISCSRLGHPFSLLHMILLLMRFKIIFSLAGDHIKLLTQGSSLSLNFYVNKMWA